MNESKAKTGHKLIAIMAAVIIAFTMYTPLTAFADDDAQAQNASEVKVQTAEPETSDQKADEDKDADAGSDDADAEKADAGADHQDADDADGGSDDEDAGVGETDAEADADGSDLDADGGAENTESASEDLDETADLDEETAGTLVNTDTPYRVTVTFGEEAGIPEGAELIVKEMPEADYIDQATAELDAGKVAFAVFLDISIVKDGEGIQPSDDVKVEVTLSDMPSDENGEMAVVHFEDENDSEAVKSSTEDTTVEFKADGFSVYGFVYTVEFTYGEYTFAIEGGSEILLSEIFSQLHIEEDLTGSETECSAPELFQIDPISGGDDTVTDWNLKSLEPFTTEETLTVNLANGDVVVITLTDDQPIETGKANPSGNVIWELYERDGKKVMEFKVLDPNASDEEKAITKIQKAGSTERIPNDDPIRKTTDKIIIHDGITGIGWKALYDTSGYQPTYDSSYAKDQDQTGVFQDFKKLTEVVPCSSIKRIGWSAFRRCDNLASFDFSACPNLEEIMNQAFSPSGMKEADLSGCSKLKMIRYSAFDGINALKSVKLPSSLETIGQYAFAACGNLETVMFPENSSAQIDIWNYAFQKTGIKSLTIPKNVIRIRRYAFSECPDLERVTFTDASSLAEMQQYSFQKDPKLDEVVDEKTKKLAFTKPAAKELFSISYNENVFDQTALLGSKVGLEIEVDDKTSEYSGSPQNGYGLTDTEHVSADGLVDEDVLTGEGYTPASGTYAATYDNGSFDKDALEVKRGEYFTTDNYNVGTLTPGNLTISKADLTITVIDQEYTYNGEEQGENNKTYSDGSKVDAPDLKGNDTITSIKLDGHEKNAGVYDGKIEASDAAIGDNGAATNSYNITYVKGKLTISKADLTITAKDQNYDYNGSAQGPAGTYTSDFDTYVSTEGLQGSDELTSVTLSGQRTNAGEYPDAIEPSAAAVGDATDNYNITYVNGKLTINPIKATVTIVGHKDSKTYNGAQQSVTGYDFSTDSDLYTKNDFTFSGTAKASRTDAGTTRMGLASNQFQNTNRNFSKVTFIVTDGSINITKRSLTITTGSASKEYDGSALTSDRYSVSGLAPGDEITVRTTGSRTAVGSSENTYTIRWGNTKRSNYDITEELGTLTVDEAGNNGGGGGNGGNGGNSGGNNAPGGNANAGAAPANGPAANIADGDVPMTDGTTIEDDPTPTAAPEEGSFWALLNLLMTLLTILIAILWIVLRRPEAAARLWAGVIIVIALAILSVIVLILTEDFTLPIHIVDKWTPLMALILVLEAVAAGVLKRKSAADQE